MPSSSSVLISHGITRKAAPSDSRCWIDVDAEARLARHGVGEVELELLLEDLPLLLGQDARTSTRWSCSAVSGSGSPAASASSPRTRTSGRRADGQVQVGAADLEHLDQQLVEDQVPLESSRSRSAPRPAGERTTWPAGWPGAGPPAGSVRRGRVPARGRRHRGCLRCRRRGCRCRRRVGEREAEAVPEYCRSRGCSSERSASRGRSHPWRHRSPGGSRLERARRAHATTRRISSIEVIAARPPCACRPRAAVPSPARRATAAIVGRRSARDTVSRSISSVTGITSCSASRPL